MAHVSKALIAVLVLSVGAGVLSAQAIRSVPRISINDLKKLMADRAVVVLDVREPEAFAKGRIPGAVNVHYTEILAKAAQFAGETRTIVAYCACVNEMTAARAAVDLAVKGVPGAKALKGGWDEWVSRGEPVEK